jgi:hypothetical protein
LGAPHVNLTVEIVGAVVVALIVGAAALRFRKLRRDEMRQLATPIERRLLTPPPSPYAPSKGFRLLDGPVDPLIRPEPMRPRLESNRDYVFSESQMANYDDVRSVPLRHNETWALSRSARRSVPFSGLRVGVITLVAVLLVGFIAYYLQGSSEKNGGVTASSTTSSLTTTPNSPVSFAPSSTSGHIATYHVPARTYLVVVTGLRGATYAMFQMGPSHTLVWQGTVAQGASKSLQMTGSSQITLGTPKNATVTVGNRPVTFPSPLPSTLTLLFTPSTSG